MNYYFNLDTQSLDIQSEAKEINGYTEITQEQHDAFFVALNEGRVVLADYSFSTSRPNLYSTYNTETGEWVDSRTSEEIAQAYLATLTPLTRRQFKLTLNYYGLLAQVDSAIASITDETERNNVLIEYQDSTTFVRTSETVITLAGLLGKTDDELNTMWEYGMTL